MIGLISLASWIMPTKWPSGTMSCCLAHSPALTGINGDDDGPVSISGLKPSPLRLLLRRFLWGGCGLSFSAAAMRTPLGFFTWGRLLIPYPAHMGCAMLRHAIAPALCHALLRHAVLRHAMLHHAVLCHTVLCLAVLGQAVLVHAVPRHAVLCLTVLRHAVLFFVVLRYTMLRHTVTSRCASPHCATPCSALPRSASPQCYAM